MACKSHVCMGTAQPDGGFRLTNHGSVQVSTKLKVGVMWDHNGTYMEGMGFQYRDHRVVIEIAQDDNLTGAEQGRTAVTGMFPGTTPPFLSYKKKSTLSLLIPITPKEFHPV